MLEFINSNGWSLIAATIIAGFILVFATFFIAFSVTLFINFVGGALMTLRGPKIIHKEIKKNAE